MPDEFENTRSGLPDRRKQPARTDNCDVHEEWQRQKDELINQARGWVKAVGMIAGVAVALFGFMGNSINGKLNTIMTVQSVDRSDIRLLNEQVTHIKSDIGELQLRMKEIDIERMRSR